jgi:hypothetical protein
MSARPLGGLKNWRDYHPAKEADLLSTALGNRVRAVERYGNDRFGLDVLILRYEFVGVAEDQVREQIEAARQEVEVFLAGTVVFALFTVATSGQREPRAGRQRFRLTLPESLGEEREFWRTLNGFVRTGSAG